MFDKFLDFGSSFSFLVPLAVVYIAVVVHAAYAACSEGKADPKDAGIKRRWRSVVS